uniref:centromere/kinetochore protein zw10 homolog n=1 Tax=Ciona intestinalis TaxID=7719 RepID=UPI000180D452|nr:centromere/kinetochore protein zw10 homolog [Ciona intestinalis]|eukprot:XP_002127662.1 centromere/kinetochore protein zw10 homolog [Ciona intestinalis]
MSSLVTEALASAGKLAKDDWNVKISKLAARAFDTKRELSECIEEEFCNFSSLRESCEDTNAKLTEIRDEAHRLEKSLETMVQDQIPDTTKKFDQLAKEHSKTVELVQVLEKLNFAYFYFRNHELDVKHKNLLQASIKLEKVKQCIESANGMKMVESQIYKALKVEYHLCKEQILYTLDEAWRDSVLWELPGDNGDMTRSPKLTISFSQNQSLSSQDVIYALYVCGTLTYKVEKLAKHCIEHMIKPCILNPGCDVNVKQNSGTASVMLNNCDGAEDENREEKEVCNHDEIFTNVLKFLQFLYDNLLKLKLEPEKDAVVMEIFSSFIFEETIKLIVDQCLPKTVPQTKEGLDNYHQVTECVNKFDASLRKIKFLPPSVEKSDLISYVADIHIHFASRRSIDILAEARRLMKLDLHDTEEINDNERKAELTGDAYNKVREAVNIKKEPEFIERGKELFWKPEHPLSDNTLCLPRCRVSKSAKSILKLAYTTLCEATKSSDQTALKLVFTTEQIFELYMAVVPIYHKEKLSSVPHITAVFHNDCWFLSHHLLTMGHQFTNKLKSKLDGKNLLFVQLVPRLRSIGDELHLAQLRRQRDQIMESLAPLRNFNSGMDAKLSKYSAAERTVKQTLHQLQHLRKVWKGVFPSNILQRSLALLTDTAISEIVSSICSMEDISSDDSIQLKMICHLMQDQVPLVFKQQDEDDEQPAEAEDSATPWQREVKKWQRLNEIIFVLDSSMTKIVDRWAEGKGPLSMAFTVAEMKSLIRALFQNTERRANAISKIRL